MPKVLLTFQDRAKERTEKIKTHCLGVKAMKHISWDDIAGQMFTARSTLVYRFNNNLFTLPEWFQLWHILGIEKEEIL